MNIWDWGREQTMKIGICDDRYEIRHKVKEILQETYTEEQGFLIHSYTPNEIKIDIEDMVFDCEILIMNTDYPESGLRGVAIAKQINAAFPFCKIIYLTENENAIKDVYETNHCYFVRQKDADQVMELAMQKAVNMVKQDTARKSLEIICDGHHVFINRPDIIYIEKCGRTIKIVTRFREYTSYKSLAGIRKMLGDNMIRVHGGYVVNLTYITYLGVETLEVQNGKTIPIGRTYVKEVRKAYQEYWKK